MMRLLVTGAGGFVGRHLLEPLTRMGYEVHGVTRTPCGPELSTLVQWHITDLLDVTERRQLVRNVAPEGLIHLAWDTTHREYWTTPRNLEWVSATLDLLLEFSRHGGQRVLVGGSCAEYQWGSETLTETATPLCPATLYGASKHAVFEILRQWAHNAPLSWAWPRFFGPYGPNEKPDRLIPRVIESLCSGRTLNFDSALEVRDFLYVEDAADAVVAVFGSEFQGAVNIGSGQGVTVRAVVEEIARQLGLTDKVRFDPAAARSVPPVLVADVSLLRGRIGWAPKRSLAEGLRLTCDWWRRCGGRGTGGERSA